MEEALNENSPTDIFDLIARDHEDLVESLNIFRNRTSCNFMVWTHNAQYIRDYVEYRRGYFTEEIIAEIYSIIKEALIFALRQRDGINTFEEFVIDNLADM